MKRTQQTSNEFSGATWQLLGAIKLPVGSTADDRIQAWLVETLRPLDLTERIFNQVLASARLGSKRERKSVDADELAYLHMSIFAPVKSLSNGQTWGFCRIEKMGESQEVNSPPHLVIEFYLYPEGK
jgi:hypothetical protein